MCWIDEGEQGNHGMSLGLFIWSGIAIALSEMEVEEEVSKKLQYEI